MKEIDLKNIWESDLRRAMDHFNSLEDVEALARKRSNNILHRIRRNMLNETAAGTVLLAAMLIVFWFWDPYLFWGFLALSVISMALSAWLYLQFARRLNRVNQKDVKNALREYIELTSQYIKRLKVILYYLSPVSMYAGLSLVVIPELAGRGFRMYLLAYGISSIAAIPIIIAIILVMNRKYIPWLYGRHLKAFRETLAGLEE